MYWERSMYTGSYKETADPWQIVCVTIPENFPQTFLPVYIQFIII